MRIGTILCKVYTLLVTPFCLLHDGEIPAERQQCQLVKEPIPVEVHTQAALVAVSGGEEREAVEGDCLTCCSLVMASSIAAAQVWVRF